ncbi:MAG: xanthine dehydrogenase family protein molybdopterin-binding subunit, partial [Pseudonocardia sp.]|nr:xanthine dehydrogenase family protein molybdopterin-binding subunit [Pseudonocardia sp.]
MPAVGQPLSRVDGPLKVTGRADYAADHDLPGLAYGVIVSGTVSRGAVTGLDTDKAASAPGVLKIVSDWSGVKLPYPTDRVNFYGQSLAVVLADTLEHAEHAASLVELSYAPGTTVTSIDDPKAEQVPAPRTPDHSRGDPDGALRAAPVTIDQTYTIMRENHNPMELP